MFVSTTPTYVRLQWGRDLLIAETPTEIAVQTRRAASMGPRSIDRGNRGDPFDPGILAHELQWGRDLLIAETVHRRSANCADECFNGAAIY